MKYVKFILILSYLFFQTCYHRKKKRLESNEISYKQLVNKPIYTPRVNSTTVHYIVTVFRSPFYAFTYNSLSDGRAGWNKRGVRKNFYNFKMIFSNETLRSIIFSALIKGWQKDSWLFNEMGIQNKDFSPKKINCPSPFI